MQKQTKVRRFIRATSAKTNIAWVFIALLAFLVVAGAITIPKFDLSQFDPFATTANGDTVAVNKQLKFAVTDRFGAASKASKTNAIKVYDFNTLQLLETLSTGSDATVNTALTYPSGTIIYVRWDDGNDDMWFQLTIPEMSAPDAESATYNNIPLRTYEIATITDQLQFGGTTIADAGEYNFTTSGSTQTFTYRLANTGSDGTGYIDSYDPIYATNWKVNVFVQFSGTDYETILVYGFEHDFTLGTTHYVAKASDANAISKWKIGNEYVSGYEGVWEMTFTLDGTGIPADSSTTTMQFYVYANSDPSWTASHGGNYGVTKLELAEHTVTLKGA